MGTFTETAIVDYHLSFAEGKQTSVFHFSLQQIIRPVGRVGKNTVFFFLPSPVGFIGFTEFHWVFWVLGFYWVFKFCICDMTFLLYILAFKCSPLHVSELPLTISPFMLIFKVQYRKYGISKFKLGRPEFETTCLLFKRCVLICRVV
jgi:hypothetical protein